MESIALLGGGHDISTDALAPGYAENILAISSNKIVSADTWHRF